MCFELSIRGYSEEKGIKIFPPNTKTMKKKAIYNATRVMIRICMWIMAHPLFRIQKKAMTFLRGPLLPPKFGDYESLVP